MLKSGLTFEQLQGIVTAGAKGSIENGKGGLRKNGKKWQVYFNYQRLDPTAPKGKRQVRLTRQTDVPATTELSDRKKRTLLNAFRADILADLEKLRGVQADPTATAGEVMMAYIDHKVQVGIATGQFGHGRGIRPTTATTMRFAAGMWRAYPSIYDSPLTNVTSAMVSDAVCQMCATHGGEGIIKAVSVLRQAATWALGKKADLPTDGVVTPPHDHKAGQQYGGAADEAEKIPAGRINVLPATEVAGVLETCAGLVGTSQEATGVAAILALTCGLRVGECCGLKWGDVHLDAETPQLEVVRSVNREVVQRDGKQHYHHFIGPTKSKTSMRPVPIPAATVTFLRGQRARVLERLLALDVKDGEAKKSISELYVCSTDLNGQFMKIDAVSNCWHRIARRHGISGENGPLTFHNLRDTYASRLYDHGMPDVRVSRLLGHSTTDITYRRYIGGTKKDAFAGVAEHQSIFDFDATAAPTGTEG